MAEKKDMALGEENAAKVTFDEALRKWEAELEDDFEADRSAERLGAEDLAIRINAKA
jgi:hypothetical protein